MPTAEVLSTSFDVGAKAFGFAVAWSRPNSGSAPATIFRMLRGRAEELSHAPDSTISVCIGVERGPHPRAYKSLRRCAKFGRSEVPVGADRDPSKSPDILVRS